MSSLRRSSSYTGSIKFFRLKLLRLSDDSIPEFIEHLENSIKQIKDEIFRIAWYMRGGVTSTDLLNMYSPEDRDMILKIIDDNIELTKKSGMPLL